MKIKLNFVDFWEGFDKYDNHFTNVIKSKYEIEFSDNPDFLFYSVFGKKHLEYKNCIKIFYTGENIRPDFTECDYAISFDYINRDNHLRYPLFLIYGDPNTLIEHRDIEELFLKKTKFCNFIVSNDKCKRRNDFFKKLNEYKKVDSGGKLFNNIGYQVDNKLDFIKQYKFTIAFENSSTVGYTTEKYISFFSWKTSSILG